MGRNDIWSVAKNGCRSNLKNNISPWQNRNADRRNPDTDKSPPSHEDAKSRIDVSNGHPRPPPTPQSAPQRTGNNGRHAECAAHKRQNRSWPPVEASFIALAIGWNGWRCNYHNVKFSARTPRRSSGFVSYTDNPHNRLGKAPANTFASALRISSTSSR